LNRQDAKSAKGEEEKREKESQMIGEFMRRQFQRQDIMIIFIMFNRKNQQLCLSLIFFP
jgi:hypothetical protein